MIAASGTPASLSSVTDMVLCHRDNHFLLHAPVYRAIARSDGQQMIPPTVSSTNPQHVYEVRPRKDRRGFDLISDALPFGGLWYTKPNDAVEYAKFRSRSHDALIRVYDDAGNVIETHEHKGDFKEWRRSTFSSRRASVLW
jgi:hypothetical protein